MITRTVLAVVSVVGTGVLASCAAAEGPGDDAPRAVVSRPAATKPAANPSAKTTPAVRRTSPAPKAVKKVVVEVRTIPFKRKTVRDPSVEAGTTSVTRHGINGTRRSTYEITLVGGHRTNKRLLRTQVVRKPVTQITTVGTKEPEQTGGGGCDPNYSGCVPVASDVDCSGGSGNGPAYTDGPVAVIGDDVYGLDRDHDGIGCED